MTFSIIGQATFQAMNTTFDQPFFPLSQDSLFQSQFIGQGIVHIGAPFKRFFWSAVIASSWRATAVIWFGSNVHLKDHPLSLSNNSRFSQNFQRMVSN